MFSDSWLSASFGGQVGPGTSSWDAKSWPPSTLRKTPVLHPHSLVTVQTLGANQRGGINLEAFLPGPLLRSHQVTAASHPGGVKTGVQLRQAAAEQGQPQVDGFGALGGHTAKETAAAIHGPNL